MGINSPQKFSRCEACNADLGSIKMDAPLYCISCIEDMAHLGMTPNTYKRRKVLR